MPRAAPFIMIVERNFIIADAARAALNGRDYRVLVVGSAGAALELATRGDPPDLVIVDLDPANGLASVGAAKGLRGVGATVIACLGFDGRAADHLIDLLRPVSVLRKPVAPEQMLRAVVGALATRRSEVGRERMALSG